MSGLRCRSLVAIRIWSWCFGWPPGGDGRGAPVGFGRIGGGCAVVEAGLSGVGLFEAGSGKDEAEGFFDAPGSAEFVDGVIAGERLVKALPAGWGEGVIAYVVEASGGPDRVCSASAVLRQVLGELLSNPGKAQVRELDQVERVDRDLRVQQATGDGFPERCRRIDRHHVDPGAPGLRTC